MKDILRLEDKAEKALLLATTASAAAASATPTGAGSAADRASSASPGTQRGITATTVFGDTFDDSGSGGGGDGLLGSSLNKKRLAVARASKLARAEAEAYADVQVKRVDVETPPNAQYFGTTVWCILV